jgi:hypothetical protein
VSSELCGTLRFAQFGAAAGRLKAGSRPQPEVWRVRTGLLRSSVRCCTMRRAPDRPFGSAQGWLAVRSSKAGIEVSGHSCAYANCCSVNDHDGKNTSVLCALQIRPRDTAANRIHSCWILGEAMRVSHLALFSPLGVVTGRHVHVVAPAAFTCVGAGPYQHMDRCRHATQSTAASCAWP